MTSTQTLTVSHQQLYDTDFVAWVDQAAELLKQGRFDELDLENLIDEVETLGRSDKKALRSNLRVLLLHLLKWQYQPSQRSNSWKGSIVEHRSRIQDTFRDSPSLKNFYLEVLDDVYEQARLGAAAETGLTLETFPTQCLFAAEQVTDHNFWPGD